MRRVICALTGLALMVSTATAGPKPKRPQPTPLLLTPAERTCQAWGQLTYALAVERDKGTALTSALGTMRQAFIRAGAGPTEQRLGTHLAYAVYAQPEVSPARAQQHFELGCLTDTSAGMQ